MKKKERSAELDMLRSLAFWGVVAQHILGAWARRGSLGLKSMALISACFELVRFAVPLFVFMFGMMLARGMKRFSAGRYYLKRARQILLPYIVWSCVYVYYYGSGAGPAELARLLLTGGAQYHLWYVPLIMQFVLLAPLFVWLFRRAEAARRPMRAWALLIGLSFLPLLALPLIKAAAAGGLAAFILREQSHIFIFWLFYFVCGAFTGLHYDEIAGRLKWHIGAFAAVSAVGIAYIIYLDVKAARAGGSVNFNVVGLQRWYYALLLAAVFVVLFAFSRRLCSFAAPARAAVFCGIHSYRAYLVHAAAIFELNRRLVAHFSFLPLYYLLLCIAAGLLSLLAAWLIDSVFACIHKQGGIL